MKNIVKTVFIAFAFAAFTTSCEPSTTTESTTTETEIEGTTTEPMDDVAPMDMEEDTITVDTTTTGGGI